MTPMTRPYNEPFKMLKPARMSKTPMISTVKPQPVGSNTNSPPRPVETT